IPAARGKSRSDSIEHVVSNVKELAASGAKEVVLTGINLGDFRSPAEQVSHRGKKENLFSLIYELDKIDEIQRYRISSIEPNLLTNEIMEFVANSDKFM